MPTKLCRRYVSMAAGGSFTVAAMLIPTALRRLVWGWVLCWPLWIGAAAPAVAASGELRQWRITPLLGAHSPDLTLINEGVFRSPFAGLADVTTAAGGVETVDFRIDNRLDPLDTAAYAGLELEWIMREDWSWFMGLGVWEGFSSASVAATVPFQRQSFDVVSHRSATLSYNDLFVGTRRTWFMPRRARVFTSFSLRNVFDMDYREDQVFRFITSDPQGFTRTAIVQAHATAVLLAQLGAGVDWLLGERFSVGIEGGYTFTLRDFYLREPDLKTDLLDTDGWGLVRLPTEPDPNRRLRYLAEDGSSYRDMPLNLDGWKVMLRFSVYY